MDESTLLVLPSYREDLPAAALGAMAYRLPVICIDAGTTDIEHHPAGLPKPGNTAAIDAATQYDLNNQAAARNRVDNLYVFIEFKIMPGRTLSGLVQTYTEPKLLANPLDRELY